MSIKSENNSTFLIKSSKNSSFGTGFVVYKSDKISYIVTCAHVIDACKEEALLVNNKVATLVAIGARDNIDLAVISVENLDSVALTLSAIAVYEEMPFLVKGFKKYINQNHKFELLDGTIKKNSQIKTDKDNIDIHELSIGLDDSIEQGYSGSAIYSKSSGYVFAVAISRYNQTHADAISIKYLKDIWEEMPLDLLVEGSILDEEESNIGILKKIINNIFSNMIEEVQISAYTILPKVYTLPLSNTIDKIIDELCEMEDESNPKNIPILCFTKKLYELNQDKRLLEWRKNTAKNIFNIELHECACIENILDGSHNIIIDIDPKNRTLSDSDIVIWEDKDHREDKVDYRIVQTYKNLDLEDEKTVQKFVDELKVYLRKFTNPRGIVLEFVLPLKFLDLDIKLWTDSENIRLPQKYPIVFRFRERFVNFEKFENEWMFHWNITYLNNKSKTLNENAEYLEDSSGIDVYTAEESACVITATPISMIKGKPIFDNGISIMISSQNCTNSEEIERFNDWFKDEFETTVIEKSIRAVNKIFARKHESFESNMILIWDNPNNMPKSSQYSIDN